MNKIVDLALKMINGVDRRYLIKSYIFGAVTFITFLYVASYADVLGIGLFLFGLISFLLFPFSTIVWDDLMNLLFPDLALILPIPIILAWKFLKLYFLFLLTLLIAPVGLAYIYISNGYYKRTP